jgi:phage/plasmid-like protein (TIGR03299 family)
MAHGIMEDDNMFYVRETPWHGLGVKVEEALTSKEALAIAKLDWQVVQHPVYVDNKLVDNYQANVRDCDNKVLGIVSDRYKIIQNQEAFEFTDALLDYDCRYETAGSLWGGKKVWMLARLPEKQILGDDVCPYLVFTNAHDGTGAIKVAITPVRVVCNNTLNLALDQTKRCWSTKHIGDLDMKMEEAKKTLELVNQYMNSLAVDAVIMAKKIVSDAEFKDFTNELFPFPMGMNVSDRKIENVKVVRQNLQKTYYHTPDIQEFVGTAWGVINAVSDMVTHSEPLRKTDSYKENLFGKVIDGHGIIDEAYCLLQEMAA